MVKRRTGRVVGGRPIAAGLVAVVAALGGAWPSPASAGQSAPLHVRVLSVDFSSSSRGWILGTVPCAKGTRCLVLERTTSGGAHWSRMRLPAALVANANHQIKLGYDFYLATPASISVRFEGRLNGWIFGAITGRVVAPGVSQGIIDSVVWSTHNGGSTWAPRLLPALGGAGALLDLEASATMVHAMGIDAVTNRVVVDSSPVGHDAWKRSTLAPMPLPAGGSQPAGAIALAGSRGWLTEGNGRGATGSAELNAQGRWVPWRSPCQPVGDTLATPMASSPTYLSVACQIGGFTGGPVTHKPPGATSGSTWIYVSTNGGASFSPGAEIATGHQGAQLLAAPTASTIFVEQATPSVYLRATFDGGDHWTRVFTGNVVSLRFPTPAFGFGLIGVPGAGSGAMKTLDGGRTWKVVAGLN